VRSTVQQFHGGAQTNTPLRDLQFTLREVDEDEITEVTDGDLVEQAFQATFELERSLQDALRSYIEQLEEGLKITDLGKEQHVESGRIDIAARDKAGSSVVIELKADKADREAVGQILGYMGDLMTNKSSVRGILVAKDFSASTLAAARVVPNLSLKKYNFNFTFEDAGKEA
jgi:RecB family endonuclease NucS